MLLETRDGVRCDFCLIEAKNKFSYYSAQFKKIIVRSNTVTVGDVEWDIEICHGCYSVLLDRCRKFISGARRGAVKCDLCPKYHSGNFEYCIVKCDCVVVDKDAPKQTEVNQNVMDFNVCSECLAELRKIKTDKVQTPLPKGKWTMGA